MVRYTGKRTDYSTADVGGRGQATEPGVCAEALSTVAENGSWW
jgi:hypothetical protein